MTIEREKIHSKNFVILMKSVLNDSNLSLKAKGMWAYLMGLPDDWKINTQELTNHSTDGYHANLQALKELEINGYCQRVKNKERGRYSQGSWIIFETKKQITQRDFQSVENLQTENLPLLSIEESSIEKTKEEKIYKKEKHEKIPEGFKPFMQSYGDHVKLQPEKYEKFCLELGKEKIDSVIEDINNYIESSGRKPYPSYAGAIRTFLKKQKEKEEKFKPKENPVIAECRAIVEKYKSEYPTDYSVDLYSTWVRDTFAQIKN